MRSQCPLLARAIPLLSHAAECPLRALQTLAITLATQQDSTFPNIPKLSVSLQVLEYRLFPNTCFEVRSTDEATLRCRSISSGLKRHPDPVRAGNCSCITCIHAIHGDKPTSTGSLFRSGPSGTRQGCRAADPAQGCAPLYLEGRAPGKGFQRAVTPKAGFFGRRLVVESLCLLFFARAKKSESPLGEKECQSFAERERGQVLLFAPARWFTIRLTRE